MKPSASGDSDTVPAARAGATAVEVYSLVARRLHWWTVALIAIIVPIGLVMTNEGFKWSEATGNALYDTHKLLGFVVLWLAAGRLAYRLRHGAPADEPTLEPWHKLAAHATHWALYALLIGVPLVGWIAAQLYPTIGLYGVASLPSFLGVDQPLSDRVFEVHKVLAYLLIATIGAHVGAALYHYVIRRDGVLDRMWTSLPRRDRG